MTCEWKCNSHDLTLSLHDCNKNYIEFDFRVIDILQEFCLYVSLSSSDYDFTIGTNNPLCVIVVFS